jgi:hypothetical protein
LFEVKDKCLDWGKKFEIHFYLWQGGSTDAEKIMGKTF